MAFTGQHYVLTFDGSFNGSENLQLIPKNSLITGSRNINSHSGGFEKRGGTSHVGTQIASDVQSLGGGMLIKRSFGSKHIYFCGNDGKIYRDSVSIKTSRSTVNYSHLTSADDKMFICNGVDAVQVDTGSSIADITTPAADWTGAAQPTAMVLHSRGASRRMFAWGVPGKEDTIYYSTLGNFQQFAGGTSGTIVVDTRHGDGVTNCISKDGTLFIFTKNNLYLLDDSSTDVATWGYLSASIKGGCISPRHAVVVKNQIFAMDSSGDVYEVLTATELRDYKRASIIEPFQIHTYIEKEWDLARVDQYHLQYEPKTRSVRIFGIRLGQNEGTVCLPYYINQNKWGSPHDATDSLDDSGLHASVSFAAESTSGEALLYTQDYNGWTWEVEVEAKSDNSNGYTASVLTPWLEMEQHGIQKRWPYGILHHRSQGDFTLTVNAFIDNNPISAGTLSLGSSSGVLGTFILDADVLGITTIQIVEFNLGVLGEKIKFQFENSGAGEDFFLSHIVLPFVSRGLRRV